MEGWTKLGYADSLIGFCINEGLHGPDRHGRDGGLSGGEGGEAEAGAEGSQSGVAELRGRVHAGKKFATVVEGRKRSLRQGL